MFVRRILPAVVPGLAILAVVGASTLARAASRLSEARAEQIVSAAGATPAVNPYGAGDTYPLYGNCSSIAAVDLDGDNKPELVAAEPDSNTVSIWHNDGSGHFVLAERVRFNGPSHTVVTADFDRDGHADLAVALETVPGVVCVLDGRGDGTFSAPVSYGVGSGSSDLVAGDLNADGWTDLVTAGYGLGTVSVLMNRGGSDFVAAVTCPEEPAAGAIAISDVDRDGWPDLVMTTLNLTVSVLRNLGDGTFAHWGAHSVADCLENIRATDLDGDGADDLVLSGEAASCQILWNDGAGAFDRLDTYPMPNHSRSIATCDLGDGGLPGLAVGTVPSSGAEVGRVVLLKNQGARSFAPALDYWFGGIGWGGNGGGPEFVGFADLDGEGLSDMFVACNRPYESGGAMSVLHRLRGAHFTGIQYYRFAGTTGALSSPAAVDFHGTGKTDLMSVGGGRLLVMPSLEDGTLGPPEDLGPGDALQALDLSGDGRTDVVSMQDSTLAVRLCGADGVLGPPVTVAGTALLCTGDFDGNHRPDLFVSRAGGTAAVLLNDGGGGFLSPLLTNVGISVFMASADFDGDGLGDLAVGYRHGVSGCCTAEGDSVAILHGNGNGTFAFLSSQQANRWGEGGTWFSSLRASELNGDGVPDLVAFIRGSTDYNGKACVLLNRGDGTFAPESVYRVPPELPLLLVGDFDRDGRPDMASIANRLQGGRLTLLMNQRDGTFQTLPILGIQNGPTAMTFGDFDGNGMPDMAITYGGVCVLVNRLPPSGNITPVLVSLVEATVDGGTAQLRWYSAQAGLFVHVERCQGAGTWRSLGGVRADDAGMIVYADSAVSPGVRYGYRLGILEGDQEVFMGETWMDVPGAATDLALAGIAPNPSSKGWDVSLLVPKGAEVSVQLHDLMGRHLASRRLGVLAPGRHDIRLGDDLDLSPGVYWVRVAQGNCEVRAKAVIIR